MPRWDGSRSVDPKTSVEPQTPRLWPLITCVVLLTIVLAAAFAVTTARTDLSLGPHRAHYAMTTDDHVVVDLGPLGTVEIESPLPLGLGLNVQVEEIPDDVRGLGEIKTFEALSGDLSSYMQFFSGPEATVTDVGWGLARDAGQRFLAALLVINGVGWAGYLVLGRARRIELVRKARPHVPAMAGGLALVIVISAVATTGANQPNIEKGRAATEVFQGTPLEGARITGRLAGVIDTYGGMLVEAYSDNEAFYATATRNVETSWDDQQTRITAEQERLNFVMGNRDDPFLLGENQDNHADADADEQAESESEVEPITMLLVSDLHCNTGMTPVIKRVAELAEVDVILNGGDTTMNGSTVEKFCVTSFAKAAPAGVPFVSVTGNHDSVESAQDMSDSGMIVLNGPIQSVAGLRLLGVADPNETRLGVGTKSAGVETPREAANRLTDLACESKEPVDIVLVHTPFVGNAVMDSGCASVQLSGHKHVRIGPERVGNGVRYVNSTTAGAVEGELTVGPLKGVAEMTVLRYDPEKRVMLDYQVIAVDPKGKASVGSPLRFPRPLPELSQE